jgi:hypothetical protein
VNEYLGCAAAAGAAACGLALSESAKSLKLMFIPFKVLSVMRCTSKAWMVAPTALVFCSNQN